MISNTLVIPALVKWEVFRFQWKKVSLFLERNDLLEVAGEATCYLLQSSLLQELKQGAVDYVTGDIISLNITYEAFLREKVGTDHASKFILS